MLAVDPDGHVPCDGAADRACPILTMPRARTRARRHTPARTVQPPPDKYFSKIVGKALDALDLVRASPGPLSLNELTLRIGLAKTSLFRILHTLEVAGYLEREPDGRYRAPASLRPLASGSLQQALVDAAVPRMKELNREFRETVSLAMRFENHIEVVATIESPQLIRMGNTVGRILPPHASSLGKAIAAFQDDDRRESLLHSYGLHRFTPHTIVEERDLKHELERIRKQGFSLDAEESVLGGSCFGAPIRGADGTVVGAISLSMPTMRLSSEKHRQAILAAIRRAADEASNELGAAFLAASI
jgi:IclR family acetate operon transcriptional repressor